METFAPPHLPAGLAANALGLPGLQGPAEDDLVQDLALPKLRIDDILAIRRWLHARVPSPLLRADVLALLLQGYRLTELTEPLPRYMLLQLAARMPVAELLELTRLFPQQPPTEAREEAGFALSLLLEDFGCLGETLSAWVSAEALEATLVGLEGLAEARGRLLNGMRHVRLTQVVANPWAAESWLSRVARLHPTAALYYTIGVPGGINLPEDLEVDDVVQAEPAEGRRGAGSRRKQEVEQVRGLLRRGRRVLCVANHTTLESREALLAEARAVGAYTEALYFDLAPEILLAQGEAQGWSIPQRVVLRALETLEAPRPHEAERVRVYDDRGQRACWTLGDGVQDGFREVLLEPGERAALTEVAD